MPATPARYGSAAGAGGDHARGWCMSSGCGSSIRSCSSSRISPSRNSIFVGPGADLAVRPLARPGGHAPGRHRVPRRRAACRDRRRGADPRSWRGRAQAGADRPRPDRRQGQAGRVRRADRTAGRGRGRAAVPLDPPAARDAGSRCSTCRTISARSPRSATRSPCSATAPTWASSGRSRPRRGSDHPAHGRPRAGRDVPAQDPAHRASRCSPATRLGDGARFSDVSFTVGAGEIVGIAGLVGSGREEVVDALYGLRRLTAGARDPGWRSRSASTRRATALAHGFALVPRDRRHAGLVLDMTVADNVNLASLDKVAVAGLERRGVALTAVPPSSWRGSTSGRRTRQVAKFLERRQPAEGRAGSLAGDRRTAVHPRRADHRRRHRRQDRALPPDRRAGRPRCCHHRLVQRRRRAAGPVRSGGGHAARPRGGDARGGRARPRRPPGADLGQRRAPSASTHDRAGPPPSPRRLGRLRHLLDRQGTAPAVRAAAGVLRAARALLPRLAESRDDPQAERASGHPLLRPRHGGHGRRRRRGEGRHRPVATRQCRAGRGHHRPAARPWRRRAADRPAPRGAGRPRRRCRQRAAGGGGRDDASARDAGDLGGRGRPGQGRHLQPPDQRRRPGA